LELGPEFTQDVKVEGVKYKGDRGCVPHVGADFDLLGIKRYTARLSPAAPKPAINASREREDAGLGFEEVVETYRGYKKWYPRVSRHSLRSVTLPFDVG
jgi:hypothetical protein